MTDGLSVADALALQNRDNDGFMEGWMNNPFIYLVWMYCMRWFNNNGLEGNSLTSAELMDGLGRQDILGNQREILQSLCNMNGTMQAGFGNIRYDNLQNMMSLQNTMTSGFYGVNSGLAENRFAQQQCCCDIKQGISGLSTENYRNTCEITTAIHAEGEATRALINSNTMQELRDKLADRDRDLLTANFQLSQQAQSANIIGTLRPFPQPAYITCSPYTTVGASYCSGTYGCGSCGA